MSPYPQALADHLGREVTTVCHCWRLTRADGSVRGFTDHDLPLSVDATLFEPGSGLTASEAKDSLGLAVDTVDVEGALSSDGILEADIAAGLYDDSTVETLLVNWRSPSDFARLRTATIGKVTRRDGNFVAELKSPAHRLDRVGGRLARRTCDAELGDARCGFDLERPGFAAAGSVLFVHANTVTVSGLEGFEAGWFAFGALTWTSGALAGRTIPVSGHRKSDAAAILTLQPGPMPASGDSFTVRAGCDKAFATCREKFANTLNFRGFPHLPGNDAAYGYVADGGVFDGGPLVP